MPTAIRQPVTRMTLALGLEEEKILIYSPLTQPQTTLECGETTAIDE
jgi:hypothetical protein